MDLLIPIRLLALLALLAAVLSPQPLLLTLFAGLFFVVAWLVCILGICKVNTDKLTLIIFPNGQTSLESNRDITIKGFLGGQQWCTRRLAVLRISIEGMTRRLVILSVQQQDADEFRRLNMWLRQNFCNDMIEKKVSVI